jgi:RimJ/RimL family protein N-acetyltransferase
MELIEFGADDNDHLDAFIEVTRAVDVEDCPWEPRRTAYRQAMFMRHGWDGEVGRWFVAYDEERPVGIAAVHTSEYDNRELAWLSVRVAPLHRRRGHGTAMLRTLQSLALDMGRPLLGIDGWDSDATQGYAAAMGFEPKSAEIRRVQVVRDAPDPAPIRQEALAMAADYELICLEGYAPAELLPDLVALTETINDAPFDDLELEDEVYSVERVHAYERAQIEAGFRFRRIVARHRPTGELAAHTVVLVDGDQPTIAEQHDTSVVRAHRGHRLGLMLKTEMMLWLAEDEPQLTHIYTNNAESNRHMIAVNDRLGYRPLGRDVEFQRRQR